MVKVHTRGIFGPVWRGETVFIIAGGTSVRDQDLSLLKGRRVIVVNSSYLSYPDADVLYFGDNRWWNEHRDRKEMHAFKGQVITTSRAATGARLIKGTRQTPPPGLSMERSTLVGVRTSLQAAMNLAFHYADWINPEVKRKRLVLLGADMRRDDKGVSHHHTPHKWENKPGDKTWDIQMTNLKLAAPVLEQFGVEVSNTSPISRLPWWPLRSLKEVLRDE